MFCKYCGYNAGDSKFCPNCGAAINETQETAQQNYVSQSQPVIQQPASSLKPKKKTNVAVIILAVIGAISLLSLVGRSSKSSSKSPAEAANSLNNQIATTAKTTPVPTTQPTPTPEPEIVLEEINPDIPLGTTYELSQGVYECGDDIPAGRYVITWVDGNQFGGTVSAKNGAKYLGSFVSIDPKTSYTCILAAGDTFEISLSKMRFTKITSLPNENYLQADGSYLMGPGYFFEGIDIPEGKYNITAVGGNQFGLTLHTRSDYFISLKQNETYNNLKVGHSGDVIEISLGEVLFEKVG